MRLESRILELDGGSPGSLTALSHDSRYHYHRLVQELLHAAPEPDGCNPPGVLCVCNQETRSSKLGLVLHSTYCKQESRTGSKKQGGHDFLEEAPWRTSVPDAPVDAERMLSAPLLSVVLVLPARRLAILIPGLLVLGQFNTHTHCILGGAVCVSYPFPPLLLLFLRSELLAASLLSWGLCNQRETKTSRLQEERSKK